MSYQGDRERGGYGGGRQYEERGRRGGGGYGGDRRDNRGYGGGGGGGYGGRDNRGGDRRDDRGYGGGGGGGRPPYGGGGGGGRDSRRDDRRGDRGEYGGGGREHGGGRGGGRGRGGFGGRGNQDTGVLAQGELVSNAIELSVDPNISWYRTGLDFHGDHSAKERKLMANALIRELGQKVGENGIIFNGTVLFSAAPLPESKHVRRQLGSKDSEISTVTCVKLTSDSNDYVSLYNNLLKPIMEETGLERSFDSYFYMDRPIQDDRMRGSVKIYPGFTTDISYRIVNGQPKMLFSFDPCHKVISTETILSIINNTGDRNRVNRLLRGTRIMTIYNRKSYGVEDIDWSKTPASTFKRRNHQSGEEETISYEQYYKLSGITIRDMKQPLLVSSGRQRERVHLIPELCVQCAIPKQAKAKLPQVTSIKPTDRLQRLNTFINDIQTKKSGELLKNFGMVINPNLITVKPVQLPPPNIIFAPNKTVRPSGEWRRDASSLTFGHIQERKTILPVLLYDQRDENLARNYWEDLKTHFRNLQAPLDVRQEIFHPYGNRESYNQALNDLIAQLPPHRPEDILLVCYVKDDSEYEVYRRVALEKGYVGQAIDISPAKREKKLDPRNKESILGNIARQIVNKFGFHSWWVTVPASMPTSLSNKQFLFVGIDVFHAGSSFVSNEDGTGFWQKRSIAAYTAKLVIGDRNFTYCDMEARDAGAEFPGQRVSSVMPASESENPGTPLLRQAVQGRAEASLNSFVSNVLGYWKAMLDEDNLIIIVYRDGVADSQLDLVDQAEVSQLKDAVPPNVHLIYTVVQKRVHTRFVMSDNGRVGNCAGGTIVEDLARADNRYNFFLASCVTNLSTNKPVHYTVSYNSHPNGMTNSELQEITWAAHHTYQNWAGTVKVPDVCQYAHKLAYTLGEAGITDPQVPTELKPTMFFL